MFPHLLFVKVNSVMVLTTRVTTSTGMLTMLANTAMAVADMTAKLSGLLAMLQNRLQIQ